MAEHRYQVRVGDEGMSRGDAMELARDLRGIYIPDVRVVRLKPKKTSESTSSCGPREDEKRTGQGSTARRSHSADVSVPPGARSEEPGINLTRDSLLDWAKAWVPAKSPLGEPGQRERFADALRQELARHISAARAEGRAEGAREERERASLEVKALVNRACEAEDQVRARENELWGKTQEIEVLKKAVCNCPKAHPISESVAEARNYVFKACGSNESADRLIAAVRAESAEINACILANEQHLRAFTAKDRDRLESERDALRKRVEELEGQVWGRDRTIAKLEQGYQSRIADLESQLAEAKADFSKAREVGQRQLDEQKRARRTDNDGELVSGSPWRPKYRETLRRLRDARLSTGMCRECGCPRVEGSKNFCLAHKLSHADASAAWERRMRAKRRSEREAAERRVNGLGERIGCT